MTSPILKIQNLRIENLAGDVLVDNANLSLMPGKVLGLIGESGAGKSTIGSSRDELCARRLQNHWWARRN
jgi:ATPase components of various ABC-type transport systems, contain duplicated ATPase